MLLSAYRHLTRVAWRQMYCMITIWQGRGRPQKLVYLTEDEIDYRNTPERLKAVLVESMDDRREVKRRVQGKTGEFACVKGNLASMTG